MTVACVFGCAGTELTGDEARFFRAVRPWGFILFGRNIRDPAQLRSLIGAMRDAVGRQDVAVLVDQEGGRVQRLGPPHWRPYPPARGYDRDSGDTQTKQSRCRDIARLIAADLREIGINITCAPVLDVAAPGASDVIGDRAFGDDVETVKTFGRAFAEGLLDAGVLPVMKHIPGHGRANADSHARLPIVEASLEALEAVDFAAFRALSDLPIAMTAHVTYAAIDPDQPATTSRIVLEGIVRGSIGFDGLLISDDIGMGALSGDFASRARAARAAGCDIVLHGGGGLAEMAQVAAGAGALDGKGAQRAHDALALIAS